VVEGERFEIAPMPPFMQHMLASGGLIPWGRERLDEDFIGLPEIQKLEGRFAEDEEVQAPR
jgi:hypothetical protein